MTRRGVEGRRMSRVHNHPRVQWTSTVWAPRTIVAKRWLHWRLLVGRKRQHKHGWGVCRCSRGRKRSRRCGRRCRLCGRDGRATARLALTKVAVQVPVDDSVQTLCRHFALGSRLDVPTRLTSEGKEGRRGLEAKVVEQLTKLIHASQAPRARARMKKSLASDERVVAREEVFVVAEEVVVIKR